MSAITSTGWWNAPSRFLPCGELMPVLPPTRGIDLRQQRGRHLHEIDAAAQDRRRKAGEIADHAAAERDDEIVALDLGRDQRFRNLFEPGIALRAFALVHDDARMSRMPACEERSLGRLQPMFGHGLVGDDGGAHARPQRGDARAERSQHVATDHDVVGAIAERDVDDGRVRMFQRRGHRAALMCRSRTSATPGDAHAARRCIPRRSCRAAHRARRSSNRHAGRSARAR